MHVLQSFKDFFPPTVGGVEGHIHQLVTGIEGIDFTVLTAARSRRTVHEEIGAVKVVRAAELIRPASTPVMPGWRRLLAEAAPDLIHAHMPNPYAELSLLSTRTAPVVASYHADIVGRPALRRLFAPIQQRFFDRAGTIVVGSERFADRAEVLAAHRSKLAIVPYGVDPAVWALRPDAADVLRQRFPGPLVVFLGRLVHYKGLEVLVEAMSGVEATCLIVGDGPLRGRIEEMVVSVGLKEKVHLLGSVPDEARAAYLHAADVFVLPSTSSAESFGISMLEAMACGTPVVSTEVGTATSWVNQHLVTGLVVEPSNPEALAGAIRALLASPARREEMGAAAAERVRDEFSLERMLALMRQVYEGAV